MLYAGVVFFAGLLVCSSGSPLMIWMGLEVTTLGMLGILLPTGGTRALKYLLPNAIAGVGFLIGCLGDVGGLMGGALAVKLGLFPFYFWVPPVAAALGPGLGLWLFLVPAKFGPVWLLSWLLEAGLFPIGVLVLAAAFGSMLGAIGGVWWIKLAMVSTGVGAWAVVGSLGAWWLPVLFLGLYGASLLILLGGTRAPGIGGPSLLQLLAVGGLPPSGVFLAKAATLTALWAGGRAWHWIAILAFSEVISWAVYLSILARSWRRSPWVRWPNAELCVSLGPVLLLGAGLL